MFDVISIGDCTTDHLFKISDAHLDCAIDEMNCQLCLRFADKIPVEKYTQNVAGNNANNSVGCARLGLKTAIYTNIGSDADGDRILKKLKSEKVDTRFIRVVTGMDSNVSAVIDFKGERTILTYHQPWEYQLPDLDKTKWIYLSSMSESFVKSNIVSQIENYLERNAVKLMFNPGTFQLKHGVKKYPKLLSLTNLFIVNLDEAKEICDWEEEKVDIKKLLKKLEELGPEMVVITDGKNGSFGFDGKSCYHLEIFPAKVVEMTGAGDSFATGLLAGLIDGQQLTEALRWGAANSASVVAAIGPQTGLLNYSQIKSVLAENKKIQTKLIN
ncbi:MAG: carbohydrate kinase family protein [Patescibacteria group bacterium]|nr:carbohydrate kinase family protein [Patescibacteria group bacterium]